MEESSPSTSEASTDDVLQAGLAKQVHLDEARRNHRPPYHRSLRGRLLEWSGEIVIVFVGVYAAFLLNEWRTHRQDRTMHEQILQSLDKQVTASLENDRVVASAAQKELEQFQRQLAAGEMPPLRLMEFSSSYDPADDIALFEMGAYRLLSFQTMEALRRSSGIQRVSLTTLRDFQQLAYELLAPHLGDPKETFYDPQTRQLRPTFAWYLRALQTIEGMFHEQTTAATALLEQVKAEQATLH